MACPANTIDSNNTGLRYAVESCIRVLPTLAGDGHDPIWYPLEPNSYGDFGAKVSTVARRPIKPSRQTSKGVVTDIEASANFQMDLTNNNHARLLQGFMFAAAREKPTSGPLNLAVIPTTAVASLDDSFAMAAATADDFLEGHLIYASGYGQAANNGLMVVGTPTAGKVVVTSALEDEAAPPADAFIQAVGFQFPTADVDITMTGNIPSLESTLTDLTTLGLMEGEWIFLGGDAAGNSFANNVGFARISSIAAGAITFDKTSWVPQAELGTAKDIRIFFGTVIRNEEAANLIARQSYQFERTLGEDENGTMAQYVIGAVANELTIDLKQADKGTLDLAFIACDATAQDGSVALKSGARPDVVASDAFNTSSDIVRTAIAIVDPTTSVPSPLFAYCTDASMKISNGVSGTKALGVLGNFDTSAGVFDVSGSLTAYFQNVDGIQAVRNNSDVTFDLILAKNNTGLVFDIPLLSLGNGLPVIEQDKPITLPLDSMAAESSFGHTLMYVNFSYLPTVASA